MVNVKREIFKWLLHAGAKNDTIRRLTLSTLPMIHGSIMLSVFRCYSPQSLLEIGVGDGRTLELFLSEVQPSSNEGLRYIGFDTFDDGLPSSDESRTDESSSKDSFWRFQNVPMGDIESIAVESKTKCSVDLVKGNTKTTLPESVPRFNPVDMVYIDGGHSYETVKSDYRSVRPLVSRGGVVVFDDLIAEPGVTEFCTELLSQTDTPKTHAIITPPSFRPQESVTLILEFSDEVCEGTSNTQTNPLR